MYDSSQLHINKEAYANNLQFVKNHVAGEARISAVVKGNAYGHGIAEIIPLAEENGINHFSVYSSNEAYQVQQACKSNSTIMIMGYFGDEEVEWAIENEIELFVFNLERLYFLIEKAKKVGKPALIHIELETGMNRTGFNPMEVNKLIDVLKSNLEFLSFEGLCTHFAGAESMSNYVRVKKQKQQFTLAEKTFKKQELLPKTVHTCCSAAALRYPKMRRDLVRIGILQYGLWPSKECFIEHARDNNSMQNPLQQVISWKTRVMSISEVAIGEYIGYGTTYLAQRNMKIAIIPIGYGHGYTRSLSNLGRVLIRGQRTGVIGIVNMNCLAIDITDVEGAENNDEVVIIGKQGGLDISIASFGELTDQVNYELLVRLPHDLPRIVI